MDAMSDQILVFRLVERVTLSVVILTISLVVMIAFWRSIQKINFRLSREELGASGTVVLGTPVFVLLTLIGYAFVSLSNPIKVESKDGGVVLMTPVADERDEMIDNDEFERLAAWDKVKSLNCLFKAAGAPSPRVMDDFAAVKVSLLEPVWSESWGDFKKLQAWALARSRQDPDAQSLDIFNAEHQIC